MNRQSNLNTINFIHNIRLLSVDSAELSINSFINIQRALVMRETEF